MAILLVPWAACTSKSPSTGPAQTCDPAQCAAGNDCIDDGSGSGPSCHKVCTQQTDCPFGYYCNDGRPKSWCAQNTLTFPSQPMGQWGAPCTPPQESGNPACDGMDGFSCYGISPSDANAFCTQFGCLGDSDCTGGWWCATVNVGPNVTTSKATYGKPPRQICLPRSYCAPCQLDHDCAPTPDGQPQYCIADSQGNGYCTSRCTATASCTADAACGPRWKLCLSSPPAGMPCTRDEDCPPSAQDYAQHCDFGPVQGGVDAGLPLTGVCAPECGTDADCDASQGQRCLNSNTSFCSPRAGVCKGDGKLCSPCRSDADCMSGGFCVQAEYSTERFCTVAGKAAANNQCSCPAGTTTGIPGVTVGCSLPAQPGNPLPPTFPPPYQCVGLEMLGGAPILGCWSKH
jgi:hypothetical protein